MEKLSGYSGDKNLEHGGYFWRMDSADSDYADIVRVIPASDMGGPSNLFYVETGSLYLPGDEREKQTAACCGWIDETKPLAPWARVDSMLAYAGLDSRSETIVQIGRADPFYDYSAPRGFSMPAVDRYISERANLRGFVAAEYVSFEVESGK